jgi:hypothetical protein
MERPEKESRTAGCVAADSIDDWISISMSITYRIMGNF